MNRLCVIRNDVGVTSHCKQVSLPAGHDVESFGRNARMWADAGAALIGGCCRTTPEHIRSVANHLAL